MNNTVLQIPIETSLRNEALLVVKKMGFLSLQEFVRVMLAQLKNNVLEISIKPKTVELSPSMIKKYDKMVKEIESGKVKTKSFGNVDEYVAYLTK